MSIVAGIIPFVGTEAAAKEAPIIPDCVLYNTEVFPKEEPDKASIASCTLMVLFAAAVPEINPAAAGAIVAVPTLPIAGEGLSGSALHPRYTTSRVPFIFAIA